MMPPARRAPTLRRGYTECRFGQLHYVDSHPPLQQTGRTPSLVLLHQNPSSSEEYRHLALEMAHDRRVLAFDTPGSGMSDWPPQPESMEALAGAIADGLAALGCGERDRVDVFGYHTGTLLAAEIALQRPRMVRRVVLSGIPFRTEAERAERLAAARATQSLTADGLSVLERFAALWRHVVADRDARVPLERAAVLFMEKAKSMDRFWWPYDGVWTYSVADRFPKIRQPVLVLQLWEDLLTQSRQAAEFLQHGQVVELPTLSRDVFEVGVGELSAELRRFLSPES